MIPLRKALGEFFNVQPGEGKLVAQLILQNTFLGIGFVLVQTPAFALFVANYGAAGLPYAYLATAVLVSLIAFGYLRIAERLTLARALRINLTFIALCSGLFWLGLQPGSPEWVFFLLPLWFQVVVNLGGLAFWTLAGRVFDIRQSKRLFGLIGSGNWLGTVIAGLAVPALVKITGTSGLMLLAGISMLIAIVFQQWTLRSQPAPLIVEPPAAHRAERKTAPTPQVWRQPYSLLIFSLIVLWWVGFFFVDNIFFNRAAAQFPSADSLANALAWRVTIEGFLALIVSTFFIGRMIQRFGLRSGLLALPTTLTMSLGALALVGSADGLLTTVFLLAAFAKVVSISIGFSLDTTAQRVLYQPFPPSQRVRVQTLAEGIVQPAAVGLAGALLLILTTAFKFGFVQLSLVFVVIGIGWIGVVLAVLRLYPVMLARIVDRRQLQAVTLNLADPASIDALSRVLHDPSPEAAIYAFNQLEQVHPEILAPEIPALLRHPAAEVRQQALAYLERAQSDNAIPLIEELLTHERRSVVRQAAIRTLALRGGLSATVVGALDQPELRRGALIGLLRSDSADTRHTAEQYLAAFAASTEMQARLTAAEALGEIGMHPYEHQVDMLLRDPIVAVQQAALTAAAGLPPDRLASYAIPALAARPLRAAAAQALVRSGAPVLPEIEVVFAAQPPDVQQRLVRVFRQVKGDESLRFLVSLIDTPDADLRTETLSALSALNYRAADRLPIDRSIRSEVAFAARLLGAEHDLGDDAQVGALRSALQAQTIQTRDRILTLLSFTHHGAALRSAREALGGDDGIRRAYALELIDNALPSDLKSLGLSLLDLTPPAWELLSAVFPQEHLTLAARLEHILSSSDMPRWTRVCAADAFKQLQTAECRAALPEVSPAQLEAAVRQPELDLDTDLRREGSSGMLSLVERVLILKSVSIFAGVPDLMLAEVAALLHEEHCVPGETLFAKGDAGDSLFIIVSGTMRVHDGENTLNQLGARAVVGEMALLDPEPRVASVTALEDTDLLRLEQEPFYELMADRIEVVRGIMHVITATLRDRLRDIADLRAQLASASRANTWKG